VSVQVDDEHVYRHYVREEDFLAEFYNLAPAAARAVGDAWHPRDDCDDGLRRQQQYFLKSGELTALVFDGAAVYHTPSGFSSVVVFLRSSTRVVSVRVRPKGKSFVGKIEVDRAPQAGDFG